MRAVFLLVLLLVPFAQGGSQQYPEWRDDLLDNNTAPYPFLDIVSGWIEVWTDDSFYMHIELGFVPPAPGIGAASAGLMYTYYHHYIVYDAAGVRPLYQNCPVAGVYLSSWVSGEWWGADGPQDDPIWSFYYGCRDWQGSIIWYRTQGDVSGSIDLLTRTITWVVPRGLPQTLIPAGCYADGWTLNTMQGEAVWWASTPVIGVGLVNGPFEDIGPNQGYARPFEFPECPELQWLEEQTTDNFDVEFDGEVAERRLTFKDPFNGTLRYSWDTESENVTISWDAAIIEGSMFMTVYDGSGEEVLDVFVGEDTTDDNTVRGAVPGKWTIVLDFDFYMREFGFELIDAEAWQSERNEPIGGEAQSGEEEAAPEEGEEEQTGAESNTVDLGETSNNLQSTSEKESPGLYVVPVLFALLALASRRRQ